MNSTDEDTLADGLRESVQNIILQGPGPDLTTVHRRGRSRRRRQQAGVAAGAAAVLAVVGAFGVAALPAGNDGLSSGFANGTATQPKTVTRTSDQAEVTALMQAALTRAGIEHPGVQARPVLDVDTDQNIAWTATWQDTTTRPKVAMSLTVHPDPYLPSDAYACPATANGSVRSCSDEVLDNGVRLRSGEDSGGGFIDGENRYSMWSPTATAFYPDGRQVVITVGLLSEEGDEIPSGVVIEDNPSAITLDQLRAVVLDPALSTIATAP